MSSIICAGCNSNRRGAEVLDCHQPLHHRRHQWRHRNQICTCNAGKLPVAILQWATQYTCITMASTVPGAAGRRDT
ncbi:MAG: hypothetical protein KatS3mg059_0643 [Thermomicrobiales bacterium]|nr:MAG: hypothetical protein KatS3mg059_0643 [Thermomicrobiales bacterium]